MHNCGGREDRRGRTRPIDEAEGWCEEEAESLAEGHRKLEGGVSAALSVHRPPSQSPTNPPPSPAASVLLISSPSPPGPSYDTPSHHCSSMDAVFSPAHPPPPMCPLSQGPHHQGQSRPSASGHREDGLHIYDSFEILKKLCSGFFKKSFYEKLCIVFSHDWTPPHLLKILQ